MNELLSLELLKILHHKNLPPFLPGSDAGVLVWERKGVYAASGSEEPSTKLCGSYY